MTNTPTYDQLSALCAQMAAALEDMRAGWKYIRDNHGDLYGVGWDRAETAADSALTAYRTLSPDPVWQRVPEGCVVVPREDAPQLEALAIALWTAWKPDIARGDNPDKALAWDYVSPIGKTHFRMQAADLLLSASSARGEGMK